MGTTEVPASPAGEDDGGADVGVTDDEPSDADEEDDGGVDDVWHGFVVVVLGGDDGGVVVVVVVVVPHVGEVVVELDGGFGRGGVLSDGGRLTGGLFGPGRPTPLPGFWFTGGRIAAIWPGSTGVDGSGLVPLA